MGSFFLRGWTAFAYEWEVFNKGPEGFWGDDIAMIYNKLIRDRIPEVIEQTGKTFRTRILNEDE